VETGIGIASTMSLGLSSITRRRSLDLKATVKVLDRVSGTFYRRARGILEEMPDHLLRELHRSMRLAIRSLGDKLDATLKALHVLYLVKGDEELYDFNVLVYAYKLALRSKLQAAPLYVIAALARLLKAGDSVNAHALAAYGVRDAIPIPNTPPGEPWEDPEAWATLIQLSYDYEIGIKVGGELLATWGLLEALASENIEE